VGGSLVYAADLLAYYQSLDPLFYKGFVKKILQIHCILFLMQPYFDVINK
jgi:hypothetical protein